MAYIRIATTIRAPIEVCFDLARSVDFHLETSVATRERVVGGVTTGLLELGDTVTWEGSHFGVRQRLTVKIVEMDRPNRFVDTMVKGAFATFEHVHEFRRQEDMTEMIDELKFKSPGGPVGALIDRLILTKYLGGFVEARNLMLKVRAEATSPSS